MRQTDGKKGIENRRDEMTVIQIHCGCGHKFKADPDRVYYGMGNGETCMFTYCPKCDGKCSFRIPIRSIA